MKKDRFKNFDNEVRDLVLDFERTVLQGQQQFFDIDELEIIIDYYLEVADQEPLNRAVQYAEYLYPGNTQVAIRRAHQLIALKQYQPALDILLQLHRDHPDDTDVAYSLGVAYSAIGEHQQAISCFEQALADGWMPERVYANIADEYYHLKDYTQALAYYETALHYDPSDPTTLYNYYDTSLLAKRLPQAVSTLDDITKRDPYNHHAWYALGLAQRDMDLFEKAIDSFQFAIDIDKSYIDAYFALSHVQSLLGNNPEAVTTLLRAVDYTEHPETIYRMIGNIYASESVYETAIIYYRKAVDQNPADAEARAAAGLCLLHMGDIPSALASARKAMNLEDALAEQRGDEGNAEVFSSCGIVYSATGHFDKASECFERMILAPNCNENHCQSYTHFLYEHKLHDLLIDFAEESLGIYPHDRFYSTFLASAYFYTNRYNKVRKVLPDTDPMLLSKLCPEVMTHPLLGPLVPPYSPYPDPQEEW